MSIDCESDECGESQYRGNVRCGNVRHDNDHRGNVRCGNVQRGAHDAHGDILEYKAVVIGGGSAGLAAAATLGRGGIGEVLLLEREEYLGGVLRQCVHDGFGLYCYGESLTGPEYAERWIESVESANVRVCLQTTVLSIREVNEGSGESSGDNAYGDNAYDDNEGSDTNDGGQLFEIDAIGQQLGGRKTIRCEVVVCSTGCRERTRGQMMIPGGRPAGIMTAGTAQYMVNVANQMPGDKVAILGSGDIGLIMARRMKLEGADVRIVLGEEATGLLRNQINCIDDFGIPIRYGWGIVSISGYGQLQGIKIAPMNPDRSSDLSRSEYIRCNLLLIACGLIPELEVLDQLDITREHPGLFICGNANKPHDLVDQVSSEGVKVALDALEYLGTNALGSDATPEGDMQDLIRISKLHIVEPKGRLNSIGNIGDGGDAGSSSGSDNGTDSNAVSGIGSNSGSGIGSNSGSGNGSTGSNSGSGCDENDGTSSRDGGRTRLMVCTTCPTGCILKVSEDGQVSGNKCDRGIEFAKSEIENPVRTFTGTVGIRGSRALLPVRTSSPVPRGKLMEIAKLSRRIKARLPVSMGDIIESNVCGTGSNLVATESIEADESSHKSTASEE